MTGMIRVSAARDGPRTSRRPAKIGGANDTSLMTWMASLFEPAPIDVCLNFETQDFDEWYRCFSAHCDSKLDCWGNTMPYARSECMNEDETCVFQSVQNPKHGMLLLSSVNLKRCEEMMNICRRIPNTAVLTNSSMLTSFRPEDVPASAAAVNLCTVVEEADFVVWQKALDASPCSKGAAIGCEESPIQAQVQATLTEGIEVFRLYKDPRLAPGRHVHWRSSTRIAVLMYGVDMVTAQAATAFNDGMEDSDTSVKVLLPLQDTETAQAVALTCACFPPKSK